MENSPFPWKQEPASPPSSECEGVAASVLPPSSKLRKFSKICPVFGRNFENFTEFENVADFGGKLENSKGFGENLENSDFDGKIEIFTDFDGNFEYFDGKFVDFDGKLEKFVDFERKAEIASHLLMNLENLEDLDDLIKDEPFLLDEKLLGDIDAPQATPVLHPLPLSPPNTSPSYPYQNVYEIIGNLTPPQSPPQSSFLTPLQNCFESSNTTPHHPEDDIAKELAVVDELVRSRIENMQFGTQKTPNGIQKTFNGITQWKFDENQTKINGTQLNVDEIQKVPDVTEWKLCYSNGTQYFPDVPNAIQDSSSSNEDWVSKKPEYWVLEPYDSHSSPNGTNNMTQSSDDDDWIPEPVTKRTQRNWVSTYGTQNKNESSDDDCVPESNGTQTKCISSDDDWVSEESNETPMKYVQAPNGTQRKNESSDYDWMPETNGIKRKWVPEEPNGTSQRKKRIKGNVEEKKVRKKEQNKNAATRYRMKKKAELEEIFLEEKELLERKGELMENVGDLLREIKYLKGLMRDLFKAKGLIE